ncbi:MAG: rod shape-determining protein MreB [Methanolobus sp.]|nr:rod shape-determining protein MreB [Methanolobus sp.]
MDTAESFQKENEAIDYPAASGTEREISYLGIDLGTSVITICNNKGSTFSEYSLIARGSNPDPETDEEDKLYFGKAALEGADLELNWPVKDLLYNGGNCGDLRALIEHCVRASGITEENEHIYAIISVPPGADTSYRRAMVDAARPLFRGLMVANGPFCVAYGNKKINGSIIIDAGACKTGICRIHDSVPEDSDYLNVPVAGENIDQELVDLLAEKYEGSAVTKELARTWKETYGFVGDGDEECRVELPIGDSTEDVMINEELRLACESIIPDIVSGILRIVSDAEPQFREALRNNIYLCGGSSKIRNLSSFIENELREVGGGKVFLLDRPEYAGAYGACMLAEKMPGEFWEKLSNCDNAKNTDVIL